MKNENPGQDYEISPYATFNVQGKTLSTSQTMDYSLQFQTFTQRECYAGHPRPAACCKDYCAHSSTSGDTEPPHTSKSPPDGLSLEISCISSQKAGVGARHRHSDSDSSGAETRGPCYQLPTRLKSPRRDSVFELESSIESADGSPEVKYHKRSKVLHRVTPSR
ncbi:uncharacterized protein LOC134541934 [Bacillus rossius redtenbacheri]|uniref:uncharacterized protein LOC134541934 n=1 Tax=Bacillus rossius redtenbacheri TaxID=93214 RepID=UPI002FDD9A7A